MARYLPTDILIEILCRLPVKSLVRFRCVSKSWLALVDDDHDFARLHLNTFNNNSDESRLLVAENVVDRDGLDCTVRCHDTFKTISEIQFSLLLSWSIVSSLHGLILLESFGALKLWSPSLRQFHDVPPVPPVGTFMVETVIGLGYDQLAKDYKLVKLIFVRETVLPSLAIYTVGADSWKIAPNQKKPCNWSSNSCLTSSVYLQGSLYFIATDVDGVWDLVSFDLSNEVFSSVSMYDTRFEPLRFKKKKLVLIDGRFYVLVNDFDSHEQSVWVLERETMSWTICYSSSIDLGRPLYVKKNGDLLTCKENSSVSNRTSDHKLVASYNPQTHEYKILQQKTSFLWCWIRYVSVYVESLFLHQCNTNMNRKKCVRGIFYSS